MTRRTEKLASMSGLFVIESLALSFDQSLLVKIVVYLSLAACLSSMLPPYGITGHVARYTVSEWNAVALKGLSVAKSEPPRASLIPPIVHTCIYEAWAAYDEKAVGRQLGGVCEGKPAPLQAKGCGTRSYVCFLF